MQAERAIEFFGPRCIRARAGQQRADQPRFPAPRLQAFASDLRVLRGLDQLDHLVDVRERDREPFEDVRARTRLAKFEDRAPRDHFATMPHERFEHVLEVQHARTAIDQRDHVDAEHRLHLGLLVEVVQHDIGRLAALDLDEDAHAVLVGLVAQFGDAFELLLLDQFGDFLDQSGLVHLVRQLGDDDRFAAVRLVDLDRGACAHQHAPAASVVRRVDSGSAVDDAGGRKIRTGNVPHQPIDADLGIVDQRDHGVDNLRQVVRRDIGRHADRDAGRTVDQQVRKARRHHRRLHLLLVVVRLEIDGVLVDVGHQLMGELRHARFGVTHRGGGVAIDRTEVALSVHQQVAQRKRLRHAHERVVHRLVAVRMELADDVADDARRLVIGLVAVRTELAHRVKHTAMHGLQAIADIR